MNERLKLTTAQHGCDISPTPVVTVYYHDTGPGRQARKIATAGEWSNTNTVRIKLDFLSSR